MLLKIFLKYLKVCRMFVMPISFYIINNKHVLNIEYTQSKHSDSGKMKPGGH